MNSACPDPSRWVHDTSILHFTQANQPCTLPAELFLILLAVATPIHLAVIVGNLYQAKLSKSRARRIALTGCCTSFLGYLVHVMLYAQGGMFEGGAAVFGLHLVGILAVSFQSLQILLKPVIAIHAKSKNRTPLAKKIRVCSVVFFTCSGTVLLSLFVAMAVYAREEHIYNTLGISLLLYGCTVSLVTPTLIVYSSGKLLAELKEVRSKSGASKSALAKLEMLTFRIGKMRRAVASFPIITVFALLPMVIMYFALGYIAYQWIFYAIFTAMKWLGALNYLLFLSKTGGKRSSSNSISRDSARGSRTDNDRKKSSRRTGKKKTKAGVEEEIRGGGVRASGAGSKYTATTNNSREEEEEDDDEGLSGAFSSRDSKEISKLSKDDEGSAQGSAVFSANGIRASKDDSKVEDYSRDGDSKEEGDERSSVRGSAMEVTVHAMP